MGGAKKGEGHSDHYRSTLENKKIPENTWIKQKDAEGHQEVPGGREHRRISMNTSGHTKGLAGKFEDIREQ